MEKRDLGSTGLKITSLGFGASGLGNMPDTYGYEVDEGRAQATLEAIFDGPVNFLDTANNYGFGRSEIRVGAATKARGGLPERRPRGQSRLRAWLVPLKPLYTDCLLSPPAIQG